MPTSDKINDLRKRVLANEPYDLAEFTEAVRQLIADRLSSFEAPKPKGKSKPVNLDDLI